MFIVQPKPSHFFMFAIAPNDCSLPHAYVLSFLKFNTLWKIRVINKNIRQWVRYVLWKAAHDLIWSWRNVTVSESIILQSLPILNNDVNVFLVILLEKYIQPHPLVELVCYNHAKYYGIVAEEKKYLSEIKMTIGKKRVLTPTLYSLREIILLGMVRSKYNMYFSLWRALLNMLSSDTKNYKKQKRF